MIDASTLQQNRSADAATEGLKEANWLRFLHDAPKFAHAGVYLNHLLIAAVPLPKIRTAY